MYETFSSRVCAGLTLLVCLLGAAPQAWAEEANIPLPAAAANANEALESSDDGVGSADGDALADDDEFEWDEPAVERDPTRGVVKGRVTSKAGGEGLIEARVTVQGTAFSTLTDLDGYFEIELPPGTYDFRIWYELHQPQRVQGVVVEVGTEQTIDVALVGDDDAILEVVVEVEADRSRAAVQMERRKRAAVVMDAVSGEEMSKTPDSSAADAMKRVVGATIVDGKYLVVRGLGGRYVNTLLEGVQVPSPEPDLPAIPLDLFPAALLSSVSVAKTATPDLPGNFAGGALLIDSKQYPNDFTLQLKAGLSGDTSGTFEKAGFSTAGGMNAFGFASGRGLPSTLPSDKPVTRTTTTPEERERIGESFSRQWGTRDDTALPNFSLQGSVGDSTVVFGNRFGYLASLSWGQGTSFDTETDRSLALDQSIDQDYVRASAVRKVKLGALGAVSYQLSSSDELSFLTLFSRTADDRAVLTSGRHPNDGEIEQTQTSFIARQLSFNQLRGHHRLENAGGLELSWQGNFSIASRDEPDSRVLAYRMTDEGPLLIRSRGGNILTSELTDRTFGGGFDLGLPLDGWKPKTGVLVSRSSRVYETRRFVYQANTRGITTEDMQLAPDQAFNDDTIGRAWDLQERTRRRDSYDADFTVLGTYAMVDVSLLEPLRLIAGARYENAHTELVADSRFATDAEEAVRMERREEDILPSLNLIYAVLPQANLRAAYAMTVARPQFREVSPADYYDYQKNRTFIGNPDLERTRIHNVDLRFEFFPGATEVLAVSVFGKRFEKPIEEVFTNIDGSVQPQNAKAATVYGLELEGRVGLYHLASDLRDFGVTANFTLAESEVDLGDKQGFLTSGKRPLQGQSPWALNFGLLYENAVSRTTAQLLYNVFGPRLSAVGIEGLEDEYEKAFHRLDLVVGQNLGSGFDLKVSATNLLDQAEVYEQADTEVSRFRPGVGASATLGWTF